MKTDETGVDQAVERQPDAEEILSGHTGLQGDAFEALISDDVVRDNLAERLPRRKPSEEMIEAYKL